MESELIQWLRGRLKPHPQLPLGLSDDAALLRWKSESHCVLTTDLLTDGVDFELAKVDPRLIGRKALAVNLSDLAAMAAKPVAALVSLALPRTGALNLAKQLYEGLLPLAEKYSLAIAGGDTNTWDGPLAISVTLVGEVAPGGPLVRSGAKPGDQIVVTGSFGGSILGRQFEFEPRVAESIWLAGHYSLHAGIDCSDGLSRDLSRVAEVSGCGAVIETSHVPIAATARELASRSNDGRTALEHALGDGEDFELILAAPPSEATAMIAAWPFECPISVIGQFVAERGLWQENERGERSTLAPQGYEH